MFRPGLESTRGMLERPRQRMLKRGPPPPPAQALCSPCTTHHLPLPSGTTAALSAAGRPGNGEAGKENRPVKFRQ